MIIMKMMITNVECNVTNLGVVRARRPCLKVNSALCACAQHTAPAEEQRNYGP